jgi:PAS domain S-box-containing protein
MEEQAAVNLIDSYNYWLVALSVLIAMFASYAALDLAGRVTATVGWTRAAWLWGGAVAMGTGIWSMHYIGMLAYILPVPVAYHWPTVLLSLFAAIVASAIALYVVSRQTMNAFRALAGSVLMGAGIASMHYIGMAAMRLPAMCQFSSFLVVLSVAFAVLISLAALWITFHFRDEKARSGWGKTTGAVVMGVAIPVMHYTGMAAASFTLSDMSVDLSHAVSISTLGTFGIATVTLILLGLALLTSWLDRHFALRTLELQEEKLKQSEAYLSEAQQLSHTGSFGWRVSTGEVTWSEEHFRIFQYDPTMTPTVELIVQRVHPEDAALVKQTVERASQDGKDFDFEHRLLMPDGSVKYVHVVAHALSDESGGIEFVGSVMDVTEQHLSRKALEKAFDEIKKSEGRLQLVIDTIPGMVWSAQPDGSVDFVNQPWVEYHGRSLEAVRAEGWETLLHPEGPVSYSDWRAVLAAGKPYEHEIRMRRADGEYRWFLSRGVPLLDEHGTLIRWYGTNIDIEDRKRAEAEQKHAAEALREAQADLAHVSRATTMGELTASLAHEVNQPITAAVTNANTCVRWLAGDTPNIEEARDAAIRSAKDGTRAAEIISRIRLLFRKGTTERELVDVNEVIREMIVLLRGEATRYAVSIRTELAADLPRLMADRVQLQQVMLNLIMNSIDAMKDADGRRELAIKSQRAEHEQLQVTVSDTGVGLPAQQANEIFNAFFTTKLQGTGLGLSISRSIVESHGGRLWAAANSPRGASFCFTLSTKVEAPE